MSDYTIDAKLDKQSRGAIEWLLNEAKIDPVRIDGGPVGAKDAVINAPEVVHFLFNAPEWRTLLPAFDRLNLPVPLDPRIPEKIRARAKEIAAYVTNDITAVPGSPEYCEQVMPRFYEAALATFADGGLGWQYPVGARAELFDLTAPQAYRAVLNPKLPFGSCSESTEKIVTGVESAEIPCPLDIIATQNHVFVQSGQYLLDPDQIGSLGWTQSISEADFAIEYYATYAKKALRIALFTQDKRTYLSALSAAQVAGCIDPGNHRVHAMNAAFATVPGVAIEELLKAIQGNPAEIQYYKMLGDELTIVSYDQWRDAVRRAVELAGPVNRTYALNMASDVCAAYESCAAWAEDLRAQDAESGDAEAILAIDALRRGVLSEAIQQAAAALVKNTDHALAHAILARAAYNAGDPTQAEASATRADALAPNLEGNRGLLATIALNRGDVVRAKREALRESVVFDGNIDATWILTQVALAEGDVVGAERLARYYRDQVKYAPDGWLLLAQVYLAKGDYLGARLIAETALEKSESKKYVPAPALRAEAHAVIARANMGQGRLQEALHHAEQSARLNPDAPAASTPLIDVLYARHEYAAGLQQSEAILTKAPQLHFGWSYKAYGLLALGRIDEARVAVREALQRNPQDFYARNTDLFLVLRDGNADALKEKLTALQKDFPTQPDAKILVSFYAYALGDIALARQQLAAVEKTYRAEPTVLFVKGMLSVDEKRWGEATKYARQLKKKKPLDYEGSFLAARIAMAKGNLKVAEKEARTALQHYPHDDGKPAQFSALRLLNDILAAQGKSE